MELYVFDKNFNYQGLIESYSSLRWVRKYNQAGEFELHIASTPHSLTLLQKGNVLFKKDDVEAGYIEVRKLSEDEQGKELLSVTGKFLTNYLDRRIVWTKETLEDTVEKNMRKMVDSEFINTPDNDRKIDNMVLGNLNNYTKKESYQTEHKKVLEELEKLSLLDDLGFRITADITNKKMIFDIYKGKDRSVNQNVLPKVIFSRDYENVLNQEYTESINNYRNVALVGGMERLEATPPIPQKFVTVGNATGLDRYETYINASNTSNEKEDKSIMTDEEYKKILTSIGNMQLGKLKELKTFDCTINPFGNQKYKIHYDLGDLVSFMNKKWNLLLTKRITEIEEIYEDSGLKLNITFGEQLPTLTTKIKQIIDTKK
jgi:hypothetical protein